MKHVKRTGSLSSRKFTIALIEEHTCIHDTFGFWVKQFNAHKKTREVIDTTSRRGTVAIVGNRMPLNDTIGMWHNIFHLLSFRHSASPILARSFADEMRLRGVMVMSKPRKKYYLSQDVRDAVFSRDGNKCLSCGYLDNLTYDHVIPKSIGGMTNVANGQTLCLDCNNKKRGIFTDYRARILP